MPEAAELRVLLLNPTGLDQPVFIDTYLSLPLPWPLPLPFCDGPPCAFW